MALGVFTYRLGIGAPPADVLGATLAVLLVAVPAALHLATGLPRLVGTERAACAAVLAANSARSQRPTNTGG